MHRRSSEAVTCQSVFVAMPHCTIDATSMAPIVPARMRWLADYTIGFVIVLVHLVMMSHANEELARDGRFLR